MERATSAACRRFMGRAADAIAASIPRAERAVIEGAGHVVDATLLAPVIERFVASP